MQKETINVKEAESHFKDLVKRVESGSHIILQQDNTILKNLSVQNILHLSLHSARCGPHRGGPSESAIHTSVG